MKLRHDATCCYREHASSHVTPLLTANSRINCFTDRWLFIGGLLNWYNCSEEWWRFELILCITEAMILRLLKLSASYAIPCSWWYVMPFPDMLKKSLPRLTCWLGNWVSKTMRCPSMLHGCSMNRLLKHGLLCKIYGTSYDTLNLRDCFSNDFALLYGLEVQFYAHSLLSLLIVIALLKNKNCMPCELCTISMLYGATQCIV